MNYLFGQNIVSFLEEPVCCVSKEDIEAYVCWSGGSLPTVEDVKKMLPLKKNFPSKWLWTEEEERGVCTLMGYGDTYLEEKMGRELRYPFYRDKSMLDDILQVSRDCRFSALCFCLVYERTSIMDSWCKDMEDPLYEDDFFDY